jgi:hypothetical protein
MGAHVTVTAAVEGPTDEVLLRRVCAFAGTSVGQVYGRSGKSYILSRLTGYNHSARFRHWVVLLDLDDDARCAPEALVRWLPVPSRLMRLRVAVRELEAWLLADPERIGGFLSIRAAEVPGDPDSIPDPKQLMVTLAGRSRRKAIREDMVPKPGSGQSVGPAYTSRMIEFIQDRRVGWRPHVAITNSESLRRCIRAILHLAQQEVNPA